MKNIDLDFNNIRSYAEFYTALEQKIALPDYFGKNLDALYDFLSGGAEMPLKLKFKNVNAFQKNTFSKLLQVMEDLKKNMQAFDFELVEKP